MGSNLVIVDLKSAYLQIHVAKDLLKISSRRVPWQKLRSYSTRILVNVAPKIMTAIVRKVLTLNVKTESATDSYIDDIIVNLQNVSVTEFVKQLSDYGLETKEPETLGACRVIGLRTYKKDNQIFWKRDNDPFFVEFVHRMFIYVKYVNKYNKTKYLCLNDVKI